MTFNEGVRADSGRVRTSRGGGRGLAIGGGLGGGGLVLVVVVMLLTGQNPASLLGGGGDTTGQGAEPGIDLSHCQTGADANEHTECRMVLTADALDVHWDGVMAEQTSQDYVMPGFEIFQDSVATGCGSATAAVGPFYCPPDSSVYLDLGFFDQLETQLGAQNAPLAQMYIVAHEWGHHAQHSLGTMEGADRTDTGPSGDAVRLELQADCYAGMFIGDAATTVDPDSGETFLQQPTAAEVRTALDAAAAVGDDRIQESAGQEVSPHSWTHGSAEQRMNWFVTGYEQGTLQACDTFAVQTP
ncbi:neutral zinc metallopeptidase [Georgenia sp. H159]|uniref:KPN_02809 family neutral zinc metallopeptidase n=1 Tax=Georgenia sp. H159 TaxID=3076115 RepID=UPI002D7856E0|nr:neutral zinc metallopeptidase [Georgenia sp. H159]